MPSLKQLTAAALVSLGLSPVALNAQDKPASPPSPHYKLTYRLLEVGADGKIANSRTYFAIIGTGQGENEPAKIRTGDRFPIPVREGSTEFQYQDVGTNIDTFHAQVEGRQLSLQVSAESSSVGKPAAIGVPNTPVIRRTSWSSSVVVTLDKPTIIFTSDNVSDTGKTELELTATEVH